MNPTSFFSESSNHSDELNSRQLTATISDEAQDDTDRKNQLEVHRVIEKRRRETEIKHFRELSSLITNSSDSKPSKPPQLVVLKTAADLLDGINSRYQNDPLLPSYLTEGEVNFLNFETSNAFLFVTTIEPTVFRVIHVTDSIQRILYFAPEQWLGQNLFSFVHPDDLCQVQYQLNQQIDKKPSIKCRLQQGNGSYSSVTIDGIIKRLDQSLKPVSTNELGYYAFIGICQLPLTNQYNEKNMYLYKNPQSLVLSCRCSPNDWKIFMVDSSVSTFPSISFELFRNKSILDFIHIDDQTYVHETLLNSILTVKDELITCRFMYSSTDILTMILDIKPFFDSSRKRVDFVELIFKNITDLIKDPNQIVE
jgi:hypothetical protein